MPPVQLLEAGVRLIYDDEGRDAKRPTTLLIYATPNGNSAEWTLGAKGTGLDWHYDIQHVGAQVRRLREVDPTRNVVLAILEAPGRSWPAFRKQHGDDAPRRIRALIDSLARRCGGDPQIVLSGHSGGGSFLFAYLDAGDSIPDNVSRIIFLDANYSYSDASGHGDKLLAWLRARDDHRLVVIAYDDREITLDGKKVVGAEGGTWRASARMIDRFSKDLTFTESHPDPFLERAALDGRLRFYLHPNPENKILHTALVGDMNGLLQALALGTASEKSWGTLGGPRAYTQWVRDLPATQPASTQPRSATFPQRPRDALGGRAILDQIRDLPTTEREARLSRELLAGNLPGFLRSFKTIRVTARDKSGREHTANFCVSPDYLSVGSDADAFRVPLTPQTARRLAASFGCCLPTRKMVDAIYAAADVKLEPRPLTQERESAGTFYEHHQIIESQLSTQGPLVAGIKKDVVLTNRLLEKPGHVAIYGWHKLDGQPIQPLTTIHVDWYVDYSHGIRLVSRRMTVDGQAMDLADVVRSAELSPLLSDEGPMDVEAMYR
jgi:hypothetical protein